MNALSSIFSGNVALALVAALTWGGGDFAGGSAVRHADGSLRAALRVVLLSHSLSLGFLLLLLFVRHDPRPAVTPLLWGLGAGFFGGVSVLSFYVCLARGAMGASAAISGLLAAAIPSAVSIGLEGLPTTTRLAGFLIAAAAIWLIASSPAERTSSRGTLWLSIASGAGFGLYFVALRMGGSGGVLWPLTLSRSVSISICVVSLAAMSRIQPLSLPAVQRSWSRSVVLWTFGTAVLDTAGNLFFIAATRRGRLDVASVLASLYPASTIALAAWVLRERPSRTQALGLALAAAAVVLITL